MKINFKVRIAQKEITYVPNYQNVLDSLNADPQAMELFASKYGTPTLDKLEDVFKTHESIESFFSRVDALKKLMNDISSNAVASERFAEKYGALTITAADALTQAQIDELFAEAEGIY